MGATLAKTVKWLERPNAPMSGQTAGWKQQFKYRSTLLVHFMLGEDVASVLTGFKKLIVQVLGKGKT